MSAYSYYDYLIDRNSLWGTSVYKVHTSVAASSLGQIAIGNIGNTPAVEYKPVKRASTYFLNFRDIEQEKHLEYRKWRQSIWPIPKYITVLFPYQSIAYE